MLYSLSLSTELQKKLNYIQLLPPHFFLLETQIYDINTLYYYAKLLICQWCLCSNLNESAQYSPSKQVQEMLA